MRNRLDIFIFTVVIYFYLLIWCWHTLIPE